ncbi:MAG: hypothetical protein QQN63_07280 [Nitrosopumilus sp.]
MASGSGASHEKGKRAGAHAKPTPCSRLRWPKAMEARLRRAGIKTQVKRCS